MTKTWTLPLVFLLGLFAFAQTSTTSLRGKVTDPSGLLVTGAELTITHPSTGFTTSVKSDKDGSYQFLQLPPGTYNLTVTARGFAKVKRDGVQLLVSTPTTVNVEMKVASESTVIEVRGETPLVNTQDASLGHAFDTEQIASIFD